MSDSQSSFRPWSWVFIAVVGLASGAAAGMNLLASSDDPAAITDKQIRWTLIAGALVMTAILLGVRLFTINLARRLDLSSDARQRFLKLDLVAYPIALTTFLGAVGVQFIGAVVAAFILLFVMVKTTALYLALGRERRKNAFSSLGCLAFLFLISGFAALIYQIVWERTLFAAFGVNIESITIVVSLFMFGLGVGSMIGGWLAGRFPNHAPILFLCAELGIGAFGVVSLPLIGYVSAMTIHGSLPTIAVAVFSLLCLPTICMGATLPILVSHLYRFYRNVGKSVGILYFINTLGSAIACFITADLLFVYLGQQAAVYVAAICNLTVGVLVSIYAKRMANIAPSPLEGEGRVRLESRDCQTG